MLTLKDFIEAIDYNITGGSEYGWRCFGTNARWLDCESDSYSASAVFDSKTQEVYVAEVHDTLNNRSYRMINPDYLEEYTSEHHKVNADFDMAYDDVKYIDLDVVEDFVEKTQAIMAGEDYDTRVSIPMDFTDEELLKYMKLAHERDMTFNDFVEEALREFIARNDPLKR